MQIELTDPVYVEKKKISAFESVLSKLIMDKRDMPFIFLTIKLTLIIVPLALYILVNKNVHWIAGLVYLTLILLFLGPYTLMLHNTCHRKLFKKKYNFLINYIHWILGGFFGQTPDTYFYHHIAMHHVENNLSDDLSSTLNYKRDSIRSFSKYLLHFYFLGIIQLSFYFRKKMRNKFALNIVIGEGIYLAIVISLCFYNFYGTLIVYILPYFITRFAMMAGNWAQHAFISKEDPENIYKNSITCINTVYNKKCFNDGYHIGHHLRPALHWTEMPRNFKDNIDEYRKYDAIVFHGLDYFQIWFLLMAKNYTFLSKRIVSMSEKYVSGEQIINLLKSRTGRVTA